MRTLSRLLLSCAVLSLFASAASAETINVSDGHGGNVRAYEMRWAEIGARGANVRIVGPCQSACTVLLAYIPHDRICVTSGASLGIHTAKSAHGTGALWGALGSDIQAWVNARGGMTADFKWLGAPDIYKFFKRC